MEDKVKMFKVKEIKQIIYHQKVSTNEILHSILQVGENGLRGMMGDMRRNSAEIYSKYVDKYEKP